MVHPNLLDTHGWWMVRNYVIWMCREGDKARCQFTSLSPSLYPRMMVAESSQIYYYWIPCAVSHIIHPLYCCWAYFPTYLKLLLTLFTFAIVPPFINCTEISRSRNPGTAMPRCGLIGVAASLYRRGGSPESDVPGPGATVSAGVQHPWPST